MLGEVLNQVSMFKNLQFISALCSWAMIILSGNP
jgi:hypothetical protein